jgi:UDP-glucose 4-epimerase
MTGHATTTSDRTGGDMLVTGGAGFIGSHLCEALLRAGHRVHVLDDLSNGDLANLAAVHGHPRFRLTIGSAADPRRLRTAVADAAAIFHLAGAVGVRWLAEAPLEVMTRNLRSTEAVLAAAAAAGVPTLITSSSEVYGDARPPFRETEPVRPGTPTSLRGGYACAKAMGEWLAMAHAHERGLPVVIARLFNTVGPRQRPDRGMVLPRFLQQAASGEPITIYGDGAQTRCFASVHDVVAALIALAATPAARGLIVNVGSDREVAIGALAAIVRSSLGSSSPLQCVPFETVFPAGFLDPQRRVPCLHRLRQLLGWVPATPIEAIVAELAALPRPVAAQA